jgi:hypothetical protein
MLYFQTFDIPNEERPIAENNPAKSVQCEKRSLLLEKKYGNNIMNDLLDEFVHNRWPWPSLVSAVLHF